MRNSARTKRIRTNYRITVQYPRYSKIWRRRAVDSGHVFSREVRILASHQHVSVESVRAIVKRDEIEFTAIVPAVTKRVVMTVDPRSARCVFGAPLMGECGTVYSASARYDAIQINDRSPRRGGSNFRRAMISRISAQIP